MLPKDQRLNLKKDFNWVAAGQKSDNGFVKVYFRFSENVKPRVGIALSKASFKKAVDRNRARRLISKGFEALYNQFPQGVNILAMPREGVLKMDADSIKLMLEQLLKRERIIK